MRVYDFGLAEDGRLFLVMEYLHGRDVEDLVLHNGAAQNTHVGCCMPQARVVHLLMQTCLALEELHEAGLVHRDIKPSNIMVCRLGTEVDFVKLIDFGLTNEGKMKRATPSAVPQDSWLQSCYWARPHHQRLVICMPWGLLPGLCWLARMFLILKVVIGRLITLPINRQKMN